MRPIRLEMQAFGPYVSKQVVEFEPFVNAGLFLIYGETGAGKTSIFDAMTYALFGQSSGGGRGDVSHMRCNLAAEEIPTVVLFEFMVGEKRYLFSREVQVYTKRNGDRELRISQNAAVWDGSAYNPFFENPKINNVRLKAEEILGLTYDQFCQVVLLPQGQFERLLTAGAVEKETVLETLFHADHWQKIVDWLCDRSNEMKREMESRKLMTSQILHQFECENAEDLKALEQRSIQELLQVETQSKEVDLIEETARKELQQAQQHEKLFADLEEAKKQQEKLMQEQEKFALLQQNIKRAAEAASLLPLRETAAQLQNEKKQRAQQKEEIKKQEERIKKAIAGHVSELYAALDEMIKQLSVVEQTQRDEKKRLDELHRKKNDLLAAYMENAAFMLSKTLKEGQPCPVCGSRVHQEQKSSSKQEISKEEIEKVEATIGRMNEQALAREKQKQELQYRLQLCEEAAGKYEKVEGAFHSGKDSKQIVLEISRLEQEQNKLAALYEVQQKECSIAEQKFESAMEVYKEKTRALGFETDKEVMKHSMEESEIERAKEAIEDFKVRFKVNEEKSLSLQALVQTLQRPDIKRLEEDYEQLKKKKESANIALGKARERQEKISDALKRFEQLQKKLDHFTQEYVQKDTFARLLQGSSGVSLKRYVLGVMLSAVTKEANRLLARVLGGRYQLHRTDESVGRARKAGLDLEVFDAYAGKKRGVGTLSGGEKFLASLALSLGLSAVVQAGSGGVRIDTMFIDEGFGTLDPESIESALSILASVKGSSRLVGIISHVQSLRENIDTAIEVKKGREGSTLVVKA